MFGIAAAGIEFAHADVSGQIRAFRCQLVAACHGAGVGLAGGGLIGMPAYQFYPLRKIVPAPVAIRKRMDKAFAKALEKIGEEAAARKAKGRPKGKSKGKAPKPAADGAEELPQSIGEDTATKHDNETSSAVAKASGTNRTYLAAADKIIEEHPELAEEVLAGTKSLTQAQREVKKQEIAKRVDWPEGKYRVIYADPPWSYGNTQPDYHTEQRTSPTHSGDNNWYTQCHTVVRRRRLPARPMTPKPDKRARELGSGTAALSKLAR